MVYNASAKAGKKGVLLNDCFYVGASLNSLLLDILLRFHVYRMVLVAGREKTFLLSRWTQKTEIC